MKLIENKKISWSLAMAVLACIPIIFLDWLVTQAFEEPEDNNFKPEEPQKGLIFLFLILLIILPIVYLKFLTLRNKSPYLLVIGVSLLWTIINMNLLIKYKHIELYLLCFCLIFLLNIIPFKKEKRVVWDSIGFFCIILSISIFIYFLNQN